MPLNQAIIAPAKTITITPPIKCPAFDFASSFDRSPPTTKAIAINISATIAIGHTTFLASCEIPLLALFAMLDGVAKLAIGLS